MTTLIADQLRTLACGTSSSRLLRTKTQKTPAASKTRGQQKEGPKDKWILYGSQHLVGVFKLHQLLHSRMSEAKQMAADEMAEPQRGIDIMGQ